MSRQVSRGSAGEYQADERAGVAWLSWRVSGRCALCLAMAAPVAAAAKLRVHVGCGFRQVGLDQQTVKLVCTNRRKQFLLDTADVALAE